MDSAGYLRASVSRLKARLRGLTVRQSDHVKFRGSVLPSKSLRFNGPDQQDDAFYLDSALAEAKRVTEKLRYVPHEMVVDIGCGQGRMAIGLTRLLPEARYLGLDVSKRSIDWCKRHIETNHPTFRFIHLDLVNARYNPSGHPMSPEFNLPVPDEEASVAYLWGVVTNMEPDFLDMYARELGRMLKPGGRLFLTANVEDDVPQFSVNPPNYVSFQCAGPLHIVRFERQHFIRCFAKYGLVLSAYLHHAAGNCQSDMYFEKVTWRGPEAAERAS
jgi:SAM-dependent methyltransferase